MVPSEGFEPSTNRLKVYCSTNWATSAYMYGTPWRTWTFNLQLRRLLLYPVELRMQEKSRGNAIGWRPSMGPLVSIYLPFSYNHLVAESNASIFPLQNYLKPIWFVRVVGGDKKVKAIEGAAWHQRVWEHAVSIEFPTHKSMDILSFLPQNFSTTSRLYYKLNISQG